MTHAWTDVLGLTSRSIAGSWWLARVHGFSRRVHGRGKIGASSVFVDAATLMRG
jgi:hypothetical protein